MWIGKTMIFAFESVLDIADKAIKFPSAALEIYNLSIDSETEIEALTDAICSDVAFSANILRLVNSPLYRRGVPTASIDQAVFRVGRAEIGQMALGMAVLGGIEKIDPRLSNLRQVVNDCWVMSTLARSLVEYSPSAKDYAFTAGLLHNIGKVVMQYDQPSLMEEALQLSIDEGVPLRDAEESLYGYNNAELAGALARHWCFPNALQAALEFQFQPLLATEHLEVVAVLALANVVSDTASHPEGYNSTNDTVPVCNILNLPEIFGDKNINVGAVYSSAIENVVTV